MVSPGLARGVWSGLAAAVLFGVSTPVAKLLLPSSGTFMLAGLLYVGAGLGLALVAPLRRGSPETSLKKEDVATISAMVVAGGIVGPLLLLVGLGRLRGGESSLLLNLEAPFTIALAVLFFGEALGRLEVLGAGAVLAGGVLLASDHALTGPDVIGALAIAGATLAWALDSNLSQRLSLRDPVAVTRVKALVAGGVNVAVALATGSRWPAAAQVAAALATGFLGYGVSIVLHLLALRHVGTARQAAYFATAPFIGAVAAVPLLGEPVTWHEIGAGLLMAAGVYLLLRARHAHPHRHEAVVHEHAHVHDLHHAHEHERDAAVAPHSHVHEHAPLVHEHEHLPDAHHRHRH